MSFYDTLPPEKQAQCKPASFGDSALFGHVVTTGAILFEHPTDRLSAMNIVAIIRELEQLPQASRDFINGHFFHAGVKTRIA